MFGLLIPSRPVLPQPTNTHSPTQCSFAIPSSPPFSHLAIFMHPGQSLPPDTLAAIYIQLPPSAEFKLLGALGPDKQSAMYKVNVGKGAAQTGSIDGVSDVKEEVMLDDATEQPVTGGPTGSAMGDVVVGISLEPAAQVRAQLDARAGAGQTPTGSGNAAGQPAPGGGVPSGDMVKRLAQRIGQNAFNFLTGFVETAPNGKEVFPMKPFQDWWGKFEKKIQLDPSFLLKDGDG